MATTGAGGSCDRIDVALIVLLAVWPGVFSCPPSPSSTPPPSPPPPPFRPLRSTAAWNVLRWRRSVTLGGLFVTFNSDGDLLPRSPQEAASVASTLDSSAPTDRVSLCLSLPPDFFLSLFHTLPINLSLIQWRDEGVLDSPVLSYIFFYLPSEGPGWRGGGVEEVN